MRSRTCVLVLALTALSLLTPVVARADDGATVRGRATDTSGQPLANVQVIAQATTLPGRIATQTTASGHYALHALPDGEYVLTFQRENLVVHKVTMRVSPGERASLEVVMTPSSRAAGVPEPIVVTIKDKEALLLDPLVAYTYRRERLAMLPLLGTAESAIALGQGSQTITFEPAVRADDTPVTLAWPGRRGVLPIDFGREVLAEVTVIRAAAPAGISPTQGGIIHMAPRRGADDWHGSIQLAGGAAGAQADAMSMSRGTNNALAGIEGSVGGRVVRGQTWFFTALKTEVTAFDEETALAGSPFESRQRTTTLFGRVTHQIGTQHRLDGTLSRVGVGSRDALFDHWRVADPGAATTDDTAHFVWSARLASQVGQATHVELRANGENLSQEAAAVESPDLAVVAPILDLPLRTGYGGRRGCLGCDPSRRSVVTVRAAVNHLLSMDGQSHELTGGYETSGHRYRPVLDVDGRFELLASRTDVANGAPVPVLVPNGSSALAWFPNMDSDLDGRTHALFVGDRWRNLSGLTVDAGLRLEWRSLAAANGADVLNDWALSPRVQVAWAPTGPDAWMLTAAFSQYAGDLPWRAEDLSLATAPAWRFVEYGGPPLNAGGPVFSTPDTLALAAAWFAASGRVPSGSIVPGVSTVAAERSRAPQTTEWAAGVGRRLDRVELRTDLVYRTSGALRARLVTPGATVLDELGQPVDTGVPEPRDDLWRRNVDVTVSVSYRAGIQAQGGASYTISRLWGTADETVTDDPSQRLAFGYPQYFDADWATPAGDLRSDRRHRAVLWGTGQPIENDTLGRLTVGFLWRLESGGPFGSVGWIDTRPYVANPGVSQPPAAVPYYFTARDAFRVNVFHRVDLSVQFARPVPGRLRGEWFVRGDLLNLFNGVVPLDPWRDAVAVTALQDPTRFAPFNPFVEQPVEGVHWARDTRLESDSRALRTLPRSFRWLVGVRF